MKNNKKTIWIRTARYHNDLFRIYWGPKKYLGVLRRKDFGRLFAGCIPEHGSKETIAVELTARRLRKQIAQGER